MFLVTLVVLLGVKFGFRKSCLCKGNDKYEVCSQPIIKGNNTNNHRDALYVYLCSRQGSSRRRRNKRSLFPHLNRRPEMIGGGVASQNEWPWFEFHNIHIRELEIKHWHKGPKALILVIEFFKQTRSYAALRAADLDWIVGPGYSLGRVHSGEKP